MEAKDYAEIVALDDDLKRVLAERGQGSPCALLVHGDSYAEVIRKEGDDITLAYWNGLTHLSAAEAAAKGYKAVAAKRIIKGNGTVMYFVVTDVGTDWYVTGKHYPAIKPRRIK